MKCGGGGGREDFRCCGGWGGGGGGGVWGEVGGGESATVFVKNAPAGGEDLSGDLSVRGFSCRPMGGGWCYKNTSWESEAFFIP